jgi:hypothetical protein
MASSGATRIQHARDFVNTAPLPVAPERTRGLSDGVVTDALKAGKKQAAVVGSEVLSFAAGVDSPWRTDLLNSSLLAQLVAKKRVPDSSRVFEWYNAYFDSLASIGWAVQDKSFAVYAEQSRNFEAHKAILRVAAALMGPAATSLVLVTTALEALRSMDADSPWIKLFNRESRSASTARFQISVAEQAPGGELSVALMAFGLEAKSSLTQVLFFKSLASDATLRHSSAKVGIDTEILAGVREGLKTKLVSYANDFIKTLPDL